MNSQVIDTIKNYPFENEDLKKTCIEGVENSFIKSGLEERIMKGVETIKTHLHSKFSPDQIKAIKEYQERFKNNLAKEIDQQLTDLNEENGTAIETEADDLSCLKDTFGLDDHFIMSTFDLGQEFIHKGDFEVAAPVFTVLTILDSLSPECWTYLGVAESGMGRGESAERAFGVALGLSPNNVYTLYYAGKHYLDKGKKEISKGFFKKVLDSKDELPALKQLVSRLM